MMKFLFVNACIRGEESRTYQLCRDYIEKFQKAKAGEDWILEEVNLNELELHPLNKDRLEQRDRLAKAGGFGDSEFDLARQIIEADHK